MIPAGSRSRHPIGIHLARTGWSCSSTSSSSRSSASNADDEHSPDFRTILREAGRNARASLNGVPRVLRLVWETHRGFTLSMGVLTLAQSAIPAVQVWLAGQLLQAVVDGVRAGGNEEAVRRMATVV